MPEARPLPGERLRLRLYRTRDLCRHFLEHPEDLLLVTLMLAMLSIPVGLGYIVVKSVIGSRAAAVDSALIRGLASQEALEHAPVYGMRLTQLRRERDMTESRLAAMLDIDRFSLADIEDGSRPMTREQLDRIGAIFGVEAEYFTALGGSVAMLPKESRIESRFRQAGRE